MAYYVTTPIYYVNAEPHLGHAYSTIGADILARHMRQRGERVFFLTGTDEHGEPVSQAAEKLGVSPRELADRNVVHFRKLFEDLECSNDFFIRTTDAGHEEEVRRYIQDLYDRGEVYQGVYEGWFCPNCADFKTDQELVDGRCPIHKIEPERKREENYFFRLSAYQERLERLYAERPGLVLPRHRYNEALAFIRQGLNDISISRSRMKWGVPVPWDPDQVVYVWFDALLNYVSALRYASGEDLFDVFWPADVHVMAKDILKFHAVIWPAMLMADGLEVPRRMFIHGFLLMGGEKMSKTLGNVIDPRRVIETYGADALRHYLFREVSFGQDGSVSTEGFEARYNTELANELGNLASRTFAMVHRYLGGVVDAPGLDGSAAGDAAGGSTGGSNGGATGGAVAGAGNVPIAPELTDFGEPFVERFREMLDEVEITVALDHAWVLVRRLNRYVEEQAPWKLAKQEGSKPQLKAALYNLTEGLRVLAVLLHPYLPQTTARLLAALGRESDCPALSEAAIGLGPDRYELGELEPLFPKIS